MQGLATAQRYYDRRVPPEYGVSFDEEYDSPSDSQSNSPIDPLTILRADIARDPDAAQDISTAWIDQLFDVADNNLVVTRLLAGDDTAALALVKHALAAVALGRAARPST